MMIMALVFVGFASCGSNDDDGGSSYNLSDKEAIATLQGRWSVKVTEYDDEGDETWTETWEFDGNTLYITSSSSTYRSSNTFSVKSGVLSYGYRGNEESHRFMRLTASQFETSDAEFHDGQLCIKMIGTKQESN